MEKKYIVRLSKLERETCQEVASLLDGKYATCDRITLVCDNLNTHTAGAFYEAFPPEQARSMFVASTFASLQSMEAGCPP